LPEVSQIFKEAQIVDYTITEEETVPGSGEIRIDNVQRYKVAGKTINMVSLIKLQVYFLPSLSIGVLIGTLGVCLVEFFLTKCDIFIQGCIPLSG
jgi:uncharacterized membrane protein